MRGRFHYSNCIKYNQNYVTQKCISSETPNWCMYTICEIETPNLWFTQMPSRGEVVVIRFLIVLALMCFLWHNLWSVSHYTMGPFSGWWRQGGNGQRYLAAPIWIYRSGFGDHRFNFFYGFASKLHILYKSVNIVHWVSVYRRCGKPDDVQCIKSSENYATSFDAGLRKLQLSQIYDTCEIW